MQQIDYKPLMAAYIRGHSVETGVPFLNQSLCQTPLEQLTGEQLAEIERAGRAAELKLYRFKDSTLLPRVHKVLGFLRGIAFDSLLDVGSGRGAFLFPMLAAFPWVEVTSVDLLDHRVEVIRQMSLGGLDRLHAVKTDICSQPFAEKTFDVVTLLEVLEHIPRVEDAVCAAVKMARKFVVVSVPSKPDNNPEHIHLLTKQRLTELFGQAGCRRLNFNGVNGHLLMVASIE